jgi:hypothetical protein
LGSSLLKESAGSFKRSGCFESGLSKLGRLLKKSALFFQSLGHFERGLSKPRSLLKELANLFKRTAGLMPVAIVEFGRSIDVHQQGIDRILNRRRS